LKDQKSLAIAQIVQNEIKQLLSIRNSGKFLFFQSPHFHHRVTK